MKLVVNDARDSVNDAVEEFERYSLRRMKLTIRNLNNSDILWLKDIDHYQEIANKEKVDISSCRGENENLLKQQVTIYSGNLYRDVNELFNNTHESRQETFNTVSLYI